MCVQIRMGFMCCLRVTQNDCDFGDLVDLTVEYIGCSMHTLKQQESLCLTGYLVAATSSLQLHTLHHHL